jgi:zinc finger protein
MDKNSYKIECPICREPVNVTILPYDTPNYGEILIMIISCSSCGYKDISITSFRSSNPKRVVFRIESKDDLFARVIKSETCTVSIPELNVVVEPCQKSQIMVTNVEGLLSWIKDLILKTEVVLESDESKLKCLEIAKKIDDAINGKYNLTIILEDISGNSILLSDKAKVESY